MADTYIDETTGAERCDECDQELGDCTCTCYVTGEQIHECAGPGCEHEES